MNKHYTFQEYIENFSSIQDSYDYYFEQQKEIDRLNEENKKFNKWIETLNKENDRLNNIINELERRFNQELELNNKWEVEDTQKFYSKKWYRDVLRDFKNMIKELKGE